MEEEGVTLDKLVKIYRKLRTKMTELTQEYDTQAEVLKGQQDEIKNAIKDGILDGDIENNYEAAYAFMLEKAAAMGLQPVR